MLCIVFDHLGYFHEFASLVTIILFALLVSIISFIKIFEPWTKNKSTGKNPIFVSLNKRENNRSEKVMNKRMCEQMKETVATIGISVRGALIEETAKLQTKEKTFSFYAYVVDFNQRHMLLSLVYINQQGVQQQDVPVRLQPPVQQQSSPPSFEEQLRPSSRIMSDGSAAASASPF